MDANLLHKRKVTLFTIYDIGTRDVCKEFTYLELKIAT